jgi:hypothetical protein
VLSCAKSRRGNENAPKPTEEFVMRNPARRQRLSRQLVLKASEGRGIMPNIQPRTSRKQLNCFSSFLYQDSNAIERVFCRLKTASRRGHLWF